MCWGPSARQVPQGTGLTPQVSWVPRDGSWPQDVPDELLSRNPQDTGSRRLTGTAAVLGSKYTSDGSH